MDIPEGWGDRIYAANWVMRVQQVAPTIGQSNAILTACPNGIVTSGSPSALFDPKQKPDVPFLDSAHLGISVRIPSSDGIITETAFHDFSEFPLEVDQNTLYLSGFSDADSPSVAGVKLWYRAVELDIAEHERWSAFWTDGCE